MSRRPLVAALAVVALMVITVLVAGGPSSDDARPGGTLALRRFLAGMGLEVREGEEPPGPPGTFVLLSDLREDAEATALLRWVERGGTLVLADPLSGVAARLGVDTAGAVAGGLFGGTDLGSGCAAPEVVGVGRLAVRLADVRLAAGPPGAVSCFRAGERAYAVLMRVGRGKVAVLGGRSPLTNEFLARAGNAAFALGLAAPEGPVVFGPPVPAGSEPPPQGLWRTLPLPGKAVVVQLVLAAAAYALIRARRLGRPVLEEPVSPIPAGELVRAAGNLYRMAGASGFAGSLIRRGAVRRLSRRLGVPASAGERVPELLARAGRLDEEELRRVLQGREPLTDDELIALGREVEELVRQVERS